MLACMRRQGLEKPGWLTPSEFAGIVPNTDAGIVREFTHAYHNLRYAGRAEEGRRMVHLLEELENRGRRR